MNIDETLKAKLAKVEAECERLREANVRLRQRVSETPFQDQTAAEQLLPRNDERLQLSGAVTVDSRPEVKVALFKSLFRGRDDVYAVRWEGKTGKTGYSPAGIREWEQILSPGRGKKRSYRHSKLFPLTEEVIKDHLLITIAATSSSYPLS